MVNSLVDGLSIPDQFDTSGIQIGEIANAAVSGAVIASGAVAIQHLNTAAVSGNRVASGGLGVQHYATSSISGNVIGSGGIMASHFATNAVSGGGVSREYPVALTGSPVYGSLSTICGSSVTDAGSVAWVVFGRGFAAEPVVVCTASDASSTTITGSPIVAGSFRAVSHGAASTPFSFWAAGSGRI